MSTRHRALGPVAVASVLLLGACGTNNSSGSGGQASATIPELNVGSTAISTMNYNKNNVGYGNGLGPLIMEPLLIQDPSGALKPWLATSWDQPNPTTYVYHLRPGVTFSDGNKLTAEDVVFSWQVYRQAGSADAYNFPTTLKSVTAPDPETVKVTLSKPNAAWASVPARPSTGVFEKSFYEAHKSTFGQPGTGVVGTGPWVMDSLDPTTGVDLTANPHYWGGKVAIQKINWKFFTNESSEAIAFRAHELDAAFPSDNRSFASTSGATLLKATGPGDQGGFQFNVLDAPWNDVHVRRAVAYALDKPSLVNAYGGYAEPLDTLIPPNLLQQLGSASDVQQAQANVPTNAYDLSKAKAEMAQSKYPNGVNVNLVVGDFGQALTNVSQAIVQQLAKIGIHATLKVQSADVNTAEALSADREAIHAQFIILGAVSTDPGDAFNYFMGSANATKGNWNSTNWSTPQVDQLIDQGFATTNNPDRLGIYAQLNNEYNVNVPYVPLFSLDATVALSSSFQWPTFSGFWRMGGPWALGIKSR